MAHQRRPLLRDARRTRAWPVLATCVIVIATLGLLLRQQAQPDGLGSVVDTTGTGTVLTLALVIDLVPGMMRSRSLQRPAAGR
jgi:hypothetical protein